MGIIDRDYMRGPRHKSSVGSHKRKGVSLWLRFRFGLWLVMKRMFGRR